MFYFTSDARTNPIKLKKEGKTDEATTAGWKVEMKE